MLSSDEYPTLEIGTVFAKRFRVLKTVGQGGFGSVYEVLDEVTRETLAMKIEKAGTEDSVLKVEAGVMKTFTNKHRHFARLVAAAKLGNINYLVMSLLGPNLHYLFKKMPTKTFTLITTIRIGMQGLEALADLHNVGFVHRDVKPSNLVVGVGEQIRTIYLIDFGLSRKYMQDKKFLIRKRSDVAFRGTPAFASVNVHESLEQGPHDDLIALLYSLVVMYNGQLPWENDTRNYQIRERKKSISKDELFAGFPKHIKVIYQYLEKCTYESLVDYKFIQHKFLQMLPNPVVDVRRPFDWELI